MNSVLGKFSGKLYALVRIVAGFLFLQHGARKLFGVLGADGPTELASLHGVGGVIEFFGGLLIMLGLFTGWAAFLSSGMMAVAYFQVHAPRGFWTVENGGELAVLYCFVFLYLAAGGNGEWSLGRAFGRK